MTLEERLFVAFSAEHARRGTRDADVHLWAARRAREAAQVWEDSKPEVDLRTEMTKFQRMTDRVGREIGIPPPPIPSKGTPRR